MKKTYHLCLSAGNEIIFRNQEDYNRAFNIFALALYKTNSTGLVEAFMSTHCHLMVQTEDPAGFMYAFRQPYSKYFNRKYCREGLLGEKCHFQLEVIGVYHLLAAMSYVLRNPLHHGVAPIPYAYPHSSANVIFQKEMGKSPTERLLPRKSFYKFIGRHAEYPAYYKMSEDGVFLRETVLDVRQVENIYISPRSFDYYMNRKTCEDWDKEQLKDNDTAVTIRLEDIESGIKLQSLDIMLKNESGRLNYKNISDIELCTEVDKKILSRYDKSSVYLLTMREQQEIAEYLANTLHVGAAQIKRCLNML